MLKRITFPVAPLGCNCTLLIDEVRHKAVVIDPGGDVDKICQRLTTAKLSVTAIVHTHAHIDHIGGAAELARHTGAPAYLHQHDAPLYAHLDLQAQFLGIQSPTQGYCQVPTLALEDGDGIAIGDATLQVLHTPGHTPGSVCFYLPELELCWTGDTLFCGAVGRTDLWGGDSQALVRSVRRLYSLKGDLLLVPGHGPTTELDRERQTNPFVRQQL